MLSLAGLLFMSLVQKSIGIKRYDIPELPTSSQTIHNGVENLEIDFFRGWGRPGLDQVEWAGGHRTTFPWDWIEAQAKPRTLEPELWHSGLSKFVFNRKL